MAGRRILHRFAAGSAALFLAAGLSACAALLRPETEPTRFYVLASVPSTAAPPMAGAAPTIGIASVTLARHLDHRSVAVRTGPNELTLAEFDQWAAPLDQHIAVVLSENLTVQVPTDRVLPLPTSRAIDVDYRIEANVIAFEWMWDAAVVVTAQWTILDGGASRELAFGRSTFRRPLEIPVAIEVDGTKSLSPESYRLIVAALSEALADLGGEIAAAVRQVHGRRSADRISADDRTGRP
jgi:uncharacterized lipoprotein YmbA